MTPPQASLVAYQHLLDTYVSETAKTEALWLRFDPADLPFRPHPKSSTVAEILKHQILSERRFFGEFMGTPEPPPMDLLPDELTPSSYARRMAQLAARRLPFFAAQDESWWLTTVQFFGVPRERVWIFWRRVLHTAHHRTQLSVYLRLMDKPVPSTYGPTADETWEGADPTTTVEAAGRA